jgi:hypothetical protein
MSGRGTRIDGYEDGKWFCQDEMFDFQSKLAYYLRNGKPTNEVASALVGSGDFAGEISLTYNIFQKITTNAADTTGQYYDKVEYAQSFGLVGAYGATTDSNAFDIHSRYFLGLGYRLAHKTGEKIPGTTHRREALFSTQIGIARIDNVEYVDSSSRQIKMTNGDLPDYSTKTCVGIETELYYPLGPYSSLFMGARLYPKQGDSSPNQWSAFIGFTYSVDKLIELLPGN